MNGFGWMNQENLAGARRVSEAPTKAWGLELDTSPHESFQNSGFQNIGEWNGLLHDPDCSMSFDYSGASLHDPNQDLNSFFGPIPTLKAPGLLHYDLARTNESSTCEAGREMMPAVAEPSSESIEPQTMHSQFSQAPSREDVSRNEPDVRSRSYKCAFCNEVNASQSEHCRHQKLHGHSCHQCGQSFTNHWSLGNHAKGTGHEAFHCIDCDSTFSRIDVLTRHKIQHSSTQKKYSCTHCKKWRAPNGFARKDHLSQHLRNYHHIDVARDSQYYYWFNRSEDLGFYGCCLHKGCSLFRPEGERRWEFARNPLFKSRGEFTKHMRKEHDETPFPCTKVGCKRVNGKGFFRKRDFMKHLKKEHGISEADDIDYLDGGMVGEGSAISQ